MPETQRGERFVIIDNFLAEADFRAAQAMVRRAAFAEVDSVVAPATDGPAFRSQGVRFDADLGTDDAGGRPRVYEQVAHAVHAERGLFGSAGPAWDCVSFAFWKYPSGSRLGWHNDAGGGRTGEFILFLHPTWKPSWAGELMLLDEEAETINAPVVSADPVERMEYLLGRSMSNPLAVLPKPNRLVLLKAGTVHTINRVDPTAADTMRQTLTGFVSRDLERDARRRRARERLQAVLDSHQP